MRELSDAALREEATALLRDLVRIDTSNPPGGETPAALLLKDYLEAAGVECELVAKVPERANLVARIRGRGQGPSLTFLGHTDVVPADARDWTHPPFSGHLDGDGYLWGRGALDMKGETAVRAVTMAILARSGFEPRGDLVFIAQADEEDGTEAVGLTWLTGVRPDIASDFSIDEGGGDRLELADGRTAVTLTVGEKATLPAVVTALGEAGHASAPGTDKNAVPRLGKLIQRLDAYQPARKVLPETGRMLEELLGTVDDDLGIALERAIRLHPTFADGLPPLLSTTIAPTRLFGSSARNVMPARASVECDCRVLPGTDADSLTAELSAALGDDVPYEIDFPEEPTGGTVSPIDTPLYRVCQDFLARHDPGAQLLPKISTGFCDSHFMRKSFGTVAYGFCPIRHTPTEITRETVHSKDERIHVDDLVYAARFHLYAAETIGAMGS
ncbi:MAG: M20/M25/M40 family metallo-hydrolase [Nocardiopsaceae bacterium]|nr:M20/M25/M40 family metallo-hydrolase [Nocardiopsaceae bacterium]